MKIRIEYISGAHCSAPKRHFIASVKHSETIVDIRRGRMPSMSQIFDIAHENPGCPVQWTGFEIVDD
jgi:hypothetical protein